MDIHRHSAKFHLVVVGWGAANSPSPHN
jgi:hypothetical protein